MVAGGHPGWAYRFYRTNSDNSLAPHAADAGRWRRAIWGPGDTLIWHVAEDPDWSIRFENVEDAVPFVAAALETWSQVGSADIRWLVDGVAQGPGKALDGRNMVSVEDDNDGTGPASYARTWWKWNAARGIFEKEECDVVLTSYTAEQLGENTWPDHVLVHEFGHCIGLAHSAVTPTGRYSSWTTSSVWVQDPAMSYGIHGGGAISTDEIVGASLLRPAPGWSASTGGISGSIRLDGEPAPFVVVSALSVDGHTRANAKVFSNEEGDFLVEGLPPGEYVLWVHPIVAHNAHPRLLKGGAPLTLDDSVLPQPVRVLSGQRTAAGSFTVREGRLLP